MFFMEGVISGKITQKKRDVRNFNANLSSLNSRYKYLKTVAEGSDSNIKVKLQLFHFPYL